MVLNPNTQTQWDKSVLMVPLAPVAGLSGALAVLLWLAIISRPGAGGSFRLSHHIPTLKIAAMLPLWAGPWKNVD